MSLNRRRLSVNRETLRELDQGRLGQAQAGAATPACTPDVITLPLHFCVGLISQLFTNTISCG